MKRFQYSLQKILDLRSFQLKQAEIELGKVNSKIAAEKRQLQLIASQKLKVQGEMDSSHDISTFANGYGYMVFLDQKRDACEERIALLQIEADKKKELVRAAMQKEKVLEKLKEHRKESWKDEMEKEEELVTDDVVTSKYGAASNV
ncbi:MAG: flagellar export protein FliJ [Treponema sp.]|nr:flagellar export protein FliJ [Treponema sp.]